jgi:hypothetical protein
MTQCTHPSMFVDPCNSDREGWNALRCGACGEEWERPSLEQDPEMLHQDWHSRGVVPRDFYGFRCV